MARQEADPRQEGKHDHAIQIRRSARSCRTSSTDGSPSVGRFGVRLQELRFQLPRMDYLGDDRYNQALRAHRHSVGNIQQWNLSPAAHDGD